MTSVEFTVLGKPQPAGSKRAFRNPHTDRIIVTDANAKSRPWKQEVAGEAVNAMGLVRMLDGPLALDLTFYVQRPKGHYGTGRNARLLKPSHPIWPAVKPDVTKLIRGVEDAMTGIVYRDDAQVVRQSARKLYGTPERVEVRVHTLPLDLTPDEIVGRALETAA